LKSVVGFSPAELGGKGTQLRVLARIPKANGLKWLSILRQLKVLERSRAWTLDASKLYFLLGDDDDAEIRYGWRLIVKADDMEQAFADMKQVVKVHTGKRRGGQVMEIDLPGATAARNQGRRGGGARPTSGSSESKPALEYFQR
jgi:hypothetical protein